MQGVLTESRKKVGILLGAYQLLESVHREVDVLEHALSLTLGGPTCVEGCGRCCEAQTPVVMHVEALYLLSTSGNHATRKIAEEWALTKHSVCPTLCSPEVSKRPLGEERARLVAEGEALQSQPCPFLVPDTKRCSIHAGRPLVCRWYSVTHAPASFCQRPLHSHEMAESRFFIAQDGARKLIAQSNALMAYLQKEYRDGAMVGFLPTMILRAADEKRLEVLKPQIAAAKLGLGYGRWPGPAFSSTQI